MAIQNDNTLVTKGDLKNLYIDKIAPYLGGGISYYHTDRTGEELKSSSFKLIQSGKADTPDNNDYGTVLVTKGSIIPFHKINGSFEEGTIQGTFKVPNGMRIEAFLSMTIVTGDGYGARPTNIRAQLYNTTDSVYCKGDNNEQLPSAYSYTGEYGTTTYNASPYAMGRNGVFQWANNTGHTVELGFKIGNFNNSQDGMPACFRTDATSMAVKEIGRIVDPVKYVSNNSDLEETPVGNIISYMGNSVPKHYLACNGASYQIGTYPELEAFIIEEFGSINYFGGDGVNTWAVPDLRGEFLRGAGTNSHTNQGNGANVGTHQDGTKHNIVYSYNNGSIGIFGAGGYDAANTDTTNPDAIQQAYTANQSISTNNNGNGTTDHTYTSRPTNTSVKYCIKCESTFHAFFANAAYKVSVKATIPSGNSQNYQVLDTTDVTGDTALIDGNYFVAPLDGWYVIGQQGSTSGAGNQSFGLEINGDSTEGQNSGIGYQGTIHLNKGDKIRTFSYNTDITHNCYLNFCLLESNYNPTIVCASDVYSENEQMIGYWKNGKPLYQKTIVTQTPSTTTDATVGNLPTNLDQLVSMFGFVETTTHGHLPIISYAESAYNIYTQARPDNGTITTRVSYSGWCSKPEYITIQYTKTTDTASSLEVENSLLLNRPDLWTIGTEYNFGGGLYGIRKTGTITAAADERVQTAIITVTGGNNPNIINSGGWIKWGDEGNNDYKYPINSTMTGLTGWGSIEGAWSVMRTGNTQIALQNTSGLARSNQAYDVWVLYTK